MEELLISVIIPVYKVEKYLKQCVDSVLNQTYRNLEIILVDDGSPDRCPEICDEYAVKDKRIKVIHKENGGSSSARETGMSRVTGHYVMFVDGDDWIDQETVEKCVFETKKDLELGCILFSYMKETTNSSIPMHIMDETIYLESDEVENKIYRRLYGLLSEELGHPERMETMSSCCMKLYKTEYAKKGKYFDTRHVGSYEDGLFNIYALEGCKKMMYLDIPFYHYRKTENSLTSTFRPRLIQQWGDLFQIIEDIIKEKRLDQSYENALQNRIALSITAIGLNELSNLSNNLFGHLRVIKNYLKQEKYHKAVMQIDIKSMPIAWKVLMISCKLQCASAVYAALVAVKIMKNR